MNFMKIMRSTLLTLFILLISSHGEMASAQDALSLPDAIIRGLENNYKMRIDKSRTTIAAKQNTWGAAGAYPSISLNGAFNNSFDDRLGENNQTGLLKGGIALNWTLFNGFAVRIRKDQLNILEEVSAGNAVLVIENTIQAIVLSYHKILLEKERLKVLQQVMQLSKDRYDYIQNRVEMGAGSTYEALQAKNAWLTDKSLFINQEMVYRSSKRELSYLLADPQLMNYELTDSLSTVDASYPLDALKEKMTAYNQTLKNQYLNLMVLQKHIALEQSGRYPSVSLNSGGDYSHYPEALNTSENIKNLSGSYSAYANLSLRYNLFNGNQVNRNIQIAKIEQEIGETQLEDIRHQLSNQLIDLYDLFEVRKELAHIAGENLKTAELNLQISTDKYKNGVINSFNFRDVQKTYLQTALSELNAIYQLIASHVDLIRITGGIITEYDAQ